jgi:SAM-dependent methyltransferase
MALPSRAARARSFDAAAARYAAHRPSYPPALLDAVEELAARPLAGARVVDVGAGTGIATALLHRRGARVLAVEPGDGMAAQFRRTLPDVPIVRGDGNALPPAGATADLVTYAQAWHWTDTSRAIPEALRVLRPGGTLALWWNVPDHDVPWTAAQQRRIRHRFGVPASATRRTAEAAGDLAFTRRHIPWSRRIPIDDHLANLGSHSAFLVLGDEGSRAFLAEERDHLLREFPDETVEETYLVDLLTYTRPGA